MSDERVDILNPQGELVTVPKAQYDAAIEQGYRPLDAAAKKEAAAREKYGTGLAAEAKAGLEGAARGLTFGGSDWALSRSGLVDQEALAERKARNPYSAGIGEAAGVIGGLAAPVGLLGAGVKGAATAGRLATEAAGLGLAKAGLEGGSLATRALASGVKAATGSAVEGALYGAGQGVSEAALGDPTDVAEKILGHATMGALLGGGLGGAAGALGGVGTKALEKFARPAAEAGEAVPGLAQQAVEGAGKASKETLLSEFLNNLAGEQALRAAGLPKSAYKKLDRLVKGLPDADNLAAADVAEEMTLHKVAADTMRKYRLAQAGDTFEDVGNRVANHINEASNRASKFIAETDAAAEGPLFNIRAYADELRTLGKQFEDRPELAAHHKAILDKVETYEAFADKQAGTVRLTDKQVAQRQRLLDKIEELDANPNRSTAADDRLTSLKEKLRDLPEPKQGAGNGNITLAKAEEMKRDFNDVMEKAGSNASTLIGKQSRGIFNRHIEEAAEKAAASPEAFAAWKTAKREQEALLPVLKGNESKLESLAANRTFSLTDNIGGAAAIAHFGVNPLGALSAMGLAVGNKVMREYGSAAISDFAARAAGGMAANRGAQALQLITMERAKNVMGQRLQGAADGIVAALGSAPKAVVPLTVDAADKLTMLPERKADDNSQVTHALHDRITEITNLANNPQLLQDRLEESMGNLPAFAPRVAAQMHFTAAQAVQHLAGVTPQNPYANSPRDIRQAWRPPMTQMVAFERTLRAIHDPMGTIEEFKDGHVTKEAADALRAVYPTMYGKLVEAIVPAVVQAPRVPLQRRLQLANMLGVELDTFTSSSFAADMQAVYAEASKQAAPAARPAVSKNYRAQQSETPLQRALSGGA